MPPRPPARLLPATLLLLAAVLAWDASGLDLAAAGWFGGPQGFPLRDNWLLSSVLHQGGRIASWAVALVLCAGIWWPFGALRRIEVHRRVQLALTTVVAVLVISGLKSISTTSCPWDLAAFGRTARYVSHWAFVAGGDGGGGRCFPAGHASAGFAFLGGYFAFREREPAFARLLLAAALAAGFLLGFTQQLRGAHFMSHTLWTGWLCWAVALTLDRLWARAPWAPPLAAATGGA